MNTTIQPSQATKMLNTYIPDTALEETLDPQLAELLFYWRALCQDGRLPARAGFDPLRFPKLLPWLLMLEVEEPAQEPQFRFRVFGTGLADRAGKDFTGKTLDDASGSDEGSAYFSDAIRQTVIQRSPIGYKGPSCFKDRDYIQLQGLMLPFASDGVNVDIIIAVNLRQ